MDKLSYALGLVIGHNLNGMGVQNINNADFAQAVADVLAGNPTALTDAEAQKIVTDFLQKQEEEKGKEAREAGEAFLADNATKEGVVVLPSGLQYLVLEEGNGKKPAATDQVKCHYEGRLIDGTVFDSSYERGESAELRVDEVIEGWTEILQIMPVGSTYEVFVPQELGYGSDETGDIKPFSCLIFKIELLGIVE